MDASDPVYHFVHNERWQLAATYRNTDSDPKEQFVYHKAGLAGRGGNSYIDRVILRDEHDADWTASGDLMRQRRDW